ncbi:MAG: tandem-95 repeat protein [Cyanobacteria bacterium P01_D01_bin.1]
MNTQTLPMTLEASNSFLDGSTGVQNWGDNVTIAAYSADGSDARISYRRVGGLGIIGARHDNQLDYDAKNQTSEQFEIDFNGKVKQVNLELGRIEQLASQPVGTWQAFSAQGNLVASGKFDPSVATSIGTDSYQFALSANKSFERLVIAATASGSSPQLANNSNFSLETLTYTRDNGSGSSKAPDQAPPKTGSEKLLTLETKDASLQASASRLIWDSGVEITGYGSNGRSAVLRKGAGGLSVRGGRFGNQIDFDADLGRGEGLNIDFGKAVRQVGVVLGRMESDDGEGLPETGLWRAYGTDGSQIATGKLDPNSAESLGSGDYRFKIAARQAIAKLTIEATAYGNGAGTQYKDNNSDFTLQSLTYSSSTGEQNGKEQDVTAGNKRPIAASDKVTVNEDASVVIKAASLLGNDSVGDGPISLTGIATKSSKGGSITNLKNGSYRYTPAADFFGSDSFRYSVADADGDTSSATVNVSVNPINDLPTAIGGFATTKAGVSVEIPVENDFGGDGPNRGAIVAGSARNGKVRVNDKGTAKNPTDDSIIYSPNPGFSGVDRLRYTISDANGDTSTATVVVDVAKEEVKNNRPKAKSDRITTKEDASVVVTAGKLLGNDDLGDVPTAITTVASSSDKGGKIKSNRNGTYTYSPKSGFSGKDSFSYTITDTDGDTSTATVNVQVDPVKSFVSPIKSPGSPVKPPTSPMEPRNRVNLTASPNYLDGTKLPQRWGREVRMVATGFDGRPARIAYYDQKSDEGFGIVSSRDRGKQIDFYQNKGSEKLTLSFDRLVDDMVLTVGMLGVNEDNTGFDETGKWTALDANGRVIGTGLIGPEKSQLGNSVRVPGTYGQYPIEVNTRSPFAELVIEATAFGHGKGGPTQRYYGENNSDFDVTNISFDVIPGTQGGF